MKISLTSISGTILSLDTFESTTVSTAEGIITILPGHEAMITALKPGIISIRSLSTTYEYAIGGGVAQITPEEVRVLADMIEEGGHDLDAIQKRKEETEKKLAELRGIGDTISMQSYIELEQEYLKDIAREQLAVSKE